MKLNIDNLEKEDLEALKKGLARELNLGKIPKNSEVIELLKDNGLKYKFRLKPTRTISGVSVIAVMTKPQKCPHGRCTYCPGDVSYAPQSYTGHEPAAMRGIQHNFDPFDQIKSRINQLTKIGHPTDKIELIIMGGTFLSYDKNYVYNFVKRSFDALNSYSQNEPSKNLDEAKKINETAKKRCVALCIESRPDYAKEKQADMMLNLGTTRVEIGVQSLSDSIYKRVERGHSIDDVAASTQILKDSGFKTLYHMMPGLYQTPDEDLSMFRKLYSDSNFRPDGLKIYPCLVLKGTKVYKEWIEGKFKPIDLDQAIELILKIKQLLPKYTRTMRINRDIPTTLVDAGVLKSNIGQMVYQEMEKRNLKCRCIRCREVGHLAKKYGIYPKDIDFCKEVYSASGGKELFLSYEDISQDILIGFLRLRIPSPNVHRKEIDENTAIVRQLNVFSPSAPIGKKIDSSYQHRGYGKKLLNKAEVISKEEYDIKKLLVISGVGAREYYRKHGYTFDGTYMKKDLA